MRILHVSSADFLGGGERYVTDLVNSFAGRGHDVYAVVRPNSPLIRELKGLPASRIKTIPMRNALDVQSARALEHFVRENQIQIIHAHMARDYPLAAYTASRSRNTRLVVTRHVLFPLGRLHKIILTQAARVIAVSEAVGLYLRSERIVPERKITVVRNGIDIARFERAKKDFDRQQFCRTWELPSEALLVGTIGELKPLKGQEEFLRAAEQIARLEPRVYFIVAGIDSSRRGENRVAVERLINELNLGERVRLIGWIDDVAPLQCALDVFVSASRAESFGLAIAEAMASRTAVVATRTEGAQEIINDGETGLLVPVGDVDAIATAVLKLVQDHARRELLGARALEAVCSNFSLERMVKETESIYQVEMASSR